MSLEGRKKLVITLPKAPLYNEFLLILGELQQAITELRTVALSFDGMIKLVLIMKEIDKNCHTFKHEARIKLDRPRSLEMNWPSETNQRGSLINRIVNLNALRNLREDVRKLRESAEQKDLELPTIQTAKYPGIKHTQSDILARVQIFIHLCTALIEVLDTPHDDMSFTRLDAALALLPSQKDFYHLVAVARAERVY